MADQSTGEVVLAMVADAGLGGYPLGVGLSRARKSG